MHRKKKKWKWFLILRVLGILLFIYVIFTYDIGEVWDQMKGVSLFFLFLSLLAQFLLLLVKSLRWHIMLSPEKANQQLIKSTGEFLESYAIGVITPGRLGELTKAGHLDGKSNVISAIFKVFFERGMDVGIFVIIAGSALLWGDLVDFSCIWSILILSAGILVFIASILLLATPLPVNITQKLFRKLDFPYTKYTGWKIPQIFGLTLLSNFLAFLSPFFLILGLPLNMNFLTSSGGVAIAGLFNMLPVTIMGLGTREVTFAYVYQQFPVEQIMAFSGLVFTTAQIGGGLIALILGELLLLKYRRKSAK